MNKLVLEKVIFSYVIHLKSFKRFKHITSEWNLIPVEKIQVLHVTFKPW